MGLETGISWTHSTYNPWRGCQRVSPGCEHCYAETLSKRNHALLGQWGPPASGGTRVIASPAMWREPLKWNAAAAKSGQPHRVFCSSLADVFEDLRELDLPREWLWALIEATPHLTWLLLTKRPQNVLRMVPAHWREALAAPYTASEPGLRVCDWPRNVWIGTTVEDQKRADERIPELLRIPAPVRFLSVEPQLERVDLGQWLGDCTCWTCGARFFAGSAECAQAEHHPNEGHGMPYVCPKCGTCEHCAGGCIVGPTTDAPGIQWVICGGESGPLARPFDLAWARSLRDQCAQAGVPFFFKQMGRRPIGLTHPIHGPILPDHPAGADQSEMPADLRVQEFPEVPRG